MKQGEMAALRDLERWVRQNKGIPSEKQHLVMLAKLLGAIDKARGSVKR